MKKALGVAEAVFMGVICIVTIPFWLPALIFVLWRDGTGFTRQDECQYLRRLRVKR